MISLLKIILAAVIVTCGYCFEISARGNEDICPPKEQINPCTCFRDSKSRRVTALCKNFTHAEDLKEIFDKNPNWELQDVHIDSSIMAYLPADMLEKARFLNMNVSHTTLSTLFDMTPVETPELNLYLYNVKLIRGLEWEDISRSNVNQMGIWNMKIRHFGKSFKENVPQTLRGVWLENTKTASITDNAFSKFDKLTVLVLTGGFIKNVTRDMFPKPSPIIFWDMSYQKISVLPDNFFAETPVLQFFLFKGNMLKTLSINVFSKTTASFNLKENKFNCICEIKWITKQKNVQRRILGDCSEPPSLKGTTIKNLKESQFNYCH